MSDAYDKIAEDIREAGFFTTSVEDMGKWSRITICGKRRDPLPGFTGNSFWVSFMGSDWYLGTWGGTIYRTPNESDVISFSIAWLTHQPDITAADFDLDFSKRYNLVVVEDEDFDHAIS